MFSVNDILSYRIDLKRYRPEFNRDGTTFLQCSFLQLKPILPHKKSTSIQASPAR